MVDLGLEHIYSGKVRDIYDAGDGRLLMVASDRMSAFDVIMDQTVPNKGRVLTAMSAFWFDEFSDVVGSHLISTDLGDLPSTAQDPTIAGRFMLVERVEMLPIECIVRGYVSGSAWKEYQRNGTIHSMSVPEGLVESDRLGEPMFTPSTKAAVGGHDINISCDDAVELLGDDLARRARELSLDLYRRGAALAAEQGIIIADTKFELGLRQGELVVADEVLTPDSSRFWPAEAWKPGSTPPSFDKQPVRDYLDGLDWDKLPPPPPLPAEVVEASAARYREAYERICGLRLSEWPGGDS